MAVLLHKRAVGVFPSDRAAEDALHELKESGFSMANVSVVAKDTKRAHEITTDAGVPEAQDKNTNLDATKGVLSGGTVGGLTGLLVGLGLLAIPGVGPIMLAGAAATTLATTIAGTGIGAAAGGLIGALVGAGIPEERAHVYNERITHGDYLVMVDGTNDEIRRAEAILSKRGIQHWEVYDAPANAEYREPIV